MADPLTIPTSPDDPFYTQTSELDGVDYILIFRYNQREKCFYLSLQTSEEIEIVSGLKLVCDVPLLAFHRNANTPAGELFIFSAETNTDPPDIGELGEGKRCTLVYFPAT